MGTFMFVTFPHQVTEKKKEKLDKRGNLCLWKIETLGKSHSGNLYICEMWYSRIKDQSKLQR